MNMKKSCPQCGEETVYGEHAHYPFCSSRCRDGDFLGWTDGKKVLSTPITDADEVLDFLDSIEGQEG
mgnify:CR=1 FL=1|jgi:endogenous inhibitor of DNA gyrase (YacG/DUF329 family)